MASKKRSGPTRRKGLGAAPQQDAVAIDSSLAGAPDLTTPPIPDIPLAGLTPPTGGQHDRLNLQVPPAIRGRVPAVGPPGALAPQSPVRPPLSDVVSNTDTPEGVAVTRQRQQQARTAPLSDTVSNMDTPEGAAVTRQRQQQARAGLTRSRITDSLGPQPTARPRAPNTRVVVPIPPAEQTNTPQTPMDWLRFFTDVTLGIHRRPQQQAPAPRRRSTAGLDNPAQVAVRASQPLSAVTPNQETPWYMAHVVSPQGAPATQSDFVGTAEKEVNDYNARNPPRPR